MSDFQNHKPFNGWIANIRFINSERSDVVIVEEPPLKGEPSSWQKLLNRVRNGEVNITGLRMQRHGLTFNALPAKSCSGYFQAYEARKKFFRSMGPGGQLEKVFQGVGSIVDDKVYIVWVNIDPKSQPYIYTDIRDLKELQIHTTMG